MASVSAIATWLIESNAISASWVAMNIGCGIDDARESLEKYFEENKDEENLHAKFVLSGKKRQCEKEEKGVTDNTNDSHLFMIVDSKDVEQAKSQFQEGSACFSQLYSLHQTTSTSTNGQLALAALQQTSDYLGSIAKSNVFVENMTIKPYDLEVKPIGKRIKASAASYTMETIKGPSYVSSGNSSSNKSRSTPSNKETTVSNFFSKSDKANEGKTKERSGKNEKKLQDEKTTEVNECKDGNDDDEEQEFDTDYKTDKKNLKKRGNKGASADDEDDGEDGSMDVDESIALTKEDEKLIAKQTGIGVKFGAMDNFVNDDVKPKLGPDGLKRKKRVLKPRVTMDDKGYMVTEMVAEEVTDDEPSPKKPSPAKSISKPKPLTEKASDGAPAKKPQQKGLMSFFNKK